MAVEAILGHADKADDLRTEVRAVSATSGGHGLYYVGAWWVAHLAGCSREFLDSLDPDRPFGRVAHALEDGDLDRAADLFEVMGARPNEAYIRLWAAEQEFASGDRAAGERQLESALAFYREVRATWFIERCEALSAGVTPEG